MVASHRESPFALTTAIAIAGASMYCYDCLIKSRKISSPPTATKCASPTHSTQTTKTITTKCASPTHDDVDLSVLPCIRNRRSVFPKSFLKDAPPVDDSIIRSLLDAALWSPFHGKNYAGNQHPAKFVVLGKQSMIDMQYLTLEYYDKNWKTHWKNEEEYREWRNMTEDEITGRWGPVSHMIAITMRRQSGPKRLPEWEEAAAVAAATQNMHIQSTKFPQLGCYWSSWHDAARDSDEMKQFLKMEDEDKCMGFFIIANVKPASSKDRRRRDRSILQVEWRS